jgi:hypothetical protein
LAVYSAALLVLLLVVETVDPRAVLLVAWMVGTLVSSSDWTVDTLVVLRDVPLVAQRGVSWVAVMAACWVDELVVGMVYPSGELGY